VAGLHGVVEADVGLDFTGQVVVPDMSDERGGAADAKHGARIPGDEVPQIARHFPEHGTDRRRERGGGLGRRGRAADDEDQE
jgi:hypothetical protein